MRDLEDLGKTNADLHNECDYVLKNFMIRQNARAEEIEALQQDTQLCGEDPAMQDVSAAARLPEEATLREIRQIGFWA